MTGLYPHQNGMFGLAHRGSRLHDYEGHLSNFLKSQNFETALFGIQHEINKKNLEWPKYDDSLLKEEKVNIVVQINGRKREILNTLPDISEENFVRSFLQFILSFKE